MTMCTTPWLAVAALTIIGCSNMGPFRASGGDDDSDPDAAVGGDGVHPDAAIDGQGQQVAMPRELGSSTHYPDALAAAGGYVYFTELGQAPYAVARVSTAGGDVDRISLGSTVPSQIIASSTAVVWTSSTAVVRANSGFTGGDPLVTTTLLTGEVALSSTDVYYARNGSGVNTNRLERVALSGGSPEPLYTTLSTAPRLATTATDLYWTSFGSGYEVRKSSLAAPGTFTTLAGVAADLVTAAGTTVCWMQQPDPNQYKYDVWCNRQGTTKRIARDYYQVFDLLVTASDVFIAVRGAGNVGEIDRYGLSTQALDTYITLGTGDLPTALATDGTDLVWIASHTVPEGSATLYAIAL